MKVIIAGSRAFSDYEVLEAAIDASGFEITEVVSGCAKGVDQLGERWAWINKIPVTQYPANWGRYGKAAGPIRNGQMAKYADALIALPTLRSKGTADMIRQARERGLEVYILTVDLSEETDDHVERKGL